MREASRKRAQVHVLSSDVALFKPLLQKPLRSYDWKHTSSLITVPAVSKFTGPTELVSDEDCPLG